MDRIDLVRTLLALLELKGIGPASIRKNLARIQAAGTSTDVLRAVTNDAVDDGVWQAAQDRAETYVQKCAELEITPIAAFDPLYPSSLLELGTAPAVLFCRGNLSLLSDPILGVIGTRKPNQFGEIVAGRIGHFYTEADVRLCNGLADGIDICTAAPGGKFLSGIVGVMACGLDLLEGKRTSGKITERADGLLAADGLLVSEFPPGAVEDQNTVIASCRVQAGLSQGLLLVQSSVDGGSRFAVGHFCKLQRSLAFIVPPEAQASETAFGANQMILRGVDGLASFVGLKTNKALKADLLPIRSRDDYNVVLHSLGRASPALI